MLNQDVKVVTVMPCYDKKLEAVRPDFKFAKTSEPTEIKEVNTVLATHELIDLFKVLEVDFSKVEPFVQEDTEMTEESKDDQSVLLQ